jgi:hypothetical protein
MGGIRKQSTGASENPLVADPLITLVPLTEDATG